MTLTDIATTEVVTTSPDSGVREVLDEMEAERVGSAVVTDGDEPIGIVSDRKIAMGLREAESIDDVTVEDVMTEELVTIEADHTHLDALEMMSDEGFRRLPIVDDGALAGIITLDDLLVISATELGYASDVIEQQAGMH